MIPKILFKQKFGLDCVFVSEQKHGSRKINLDIEDKMKQHWLDIVKNSNKECWDSDIYRLESFKIENEKINFQLSTVKFSIMKTMKYCASEIDNLGEEYFSKGMFVSGIIKTKDNKYILGKLSGKTLNQNCIDFIGGIVSKQEIKIKSSEDLFEFMYKELIEESNISKSDIIKFELLGGILNNNFQIALIFNIDLSISSQEVCNKFKMQNDGEMKEIICLNKDEFIETICNIGTWKSLVIQFM